MNPAQPDLRGLFGGSLQHVPGLGYVSAGGSGPLGDEAAVMMISGVGEGEGGDPRQRASAASIDRGAQTLRSILTQPVQIGGLTQPLWVWLLAATGIVGAAGWYFFLKKK